jgi:hypothetical protein
MTSTDHRSTSPSSGSASGTTMNRVLPMALAGLALSAGLTAVGTFVGPNDTGDATRDDVSTWLVCVAIAAVTALIAFGLVVRTAGSGNPSRRAAILSVVSVLSVAVFWAGLPGVLAAAAVACALVDRDKVGSLGTGSKAGLALAALATAGATVLAFVG